MEYKDAIGQELQVGDYVLYPVRAGSRLWYSFAVIHKLTSYYDYSKREDSPAIGVTLVSEKFNTTSKEWEFKTRKTVVRAVNRVVLIDREKVNRNSVEEQFKIIEEADDNSTKN